MSGANIASCLLIQNFISVWLSRSKVGKIKLWPCNLPGPNVGKSRITRKKRVNMG